MASQAFGKSLRLLTSSAFQSVFQDAPIRASHQNFLILARFNQFAYPRLGVVVGKKHVRLATRRNRLKRHIRETFRLRQQTLSGLDVIVLARKGMDELSDQELQAQLNSQWQRLVDRARKANIQSTTG